MLWATGSQAPFRWDETKKTSKKKKKDTVEGRKTKNQLQVFLVKETFGNSKRTGNYFDVLIPFRSMDKRSVEVRVLCHGGGGARL